jgi:hypothetical protein
MLSGLDVGSHGEHGMHLATYSPHEVEEYAFSSASEGVELVSSASPADVHHQHHQHQQQQQQSPNYPSPASTITPRDSPHAQDASAAGVGTSNVPISTSSELAFALESKPDQKVPRPGQEQYLTYSGSGSEHQNVSEQDGASSVYYPQQQQEQEHISKQHQEQELAYPPSGYPEAYAEAHQQQLDSYIAGYSQTLGTSGGYADPSVSVGMDNGMQSVDAFVAYT